MAILSDISICACCGKEGNTRDMNSCNKCKEVKYCNAACKKKHRSKHKKACERRVTELYDEKLFKDVEPDECPICFLPLSGRENTETFMSCCGKVICIGCIYAMIESEGGKDLCAFCRTPPVISNEDVIKRVKKLMEKGNADAFHYLGGLYSQGKCGLPQDLQMANELNLKAGELGSAKGYYRLGHSYDFGRGVEVDNKKALHYYELASMGGYVNARFNLGGREVRDGNDHRGIKHLILAARGGHEKSLAAVKMGFTNGYLTKDEYANVLRAYHERQKEMKSDERDKADSFYRLLNRGR